MLFENREIYILRAPVFNLYITYSNPAGSVHDPIGILQILSFGNE